MKINMMTRGNPIYATPQIVQIYSLPGTPCEVRSGDKVLALEANKPGLYSVHISPEHRLSEARGSSRKVMGKSWGDT